MNRSKDLDNIAPDDPITSNAQSDVQQDTPYLESQSDIKDQNQNNINKVYDILGHTKSPFSSFLVNPKVISFSERNANETIYLAVRSHWVTNLHWVITAILMLFVPFFFKYFTFLNFFPSQYHFSLIFFWYLFTFIFAFEKFLDWYFDLFLVTNQRLVDIDFNNLLNKHFAEADLNMIQDVSSSVKGILGTFFNYGDVLIQTAAEINQINFEKVPNPEKIIKLLKELRQNPPKQGGLHD